MLLYTQDGFVQMGFDWVFSTDSLGLLLFVSSSIFLEDLIVFCISEYHDAEVSVIFLAEGM